ncbi:MAG: S9 family peptidase [Bacteroidetes bacterium]|nr:S9 family peptidase [Bacteroidota bacterium]
MKKSILFLFALSLLNNVKADWLTPESLWKLGRVSDARISPDGNSVVYNIRNFDVQKNKGNSDLWIYDFKTKSTIAIANDSVNETMPRWSTDGKRIYYLNDGGSSQIWSMNADGSNKKQISKTTSDISNYGFSSDGKTVWMTMDVQLDNFYGKDKYPDLPKTTGKVYDDLMMRQWDSWTNGSYSHVFVAQMNDGIVGNAVDLLKDEHYDSPLKPNGGDEEISISPDGKLIAYTCKKLSKRDYALTTNSDIFLYNVVTGATTNISSENTAYDKAPSFSRDGKSIAWISWDEPINEASKQRLMIYELASKTKSDITSDFSFNVEAIQWSASGNRVYFISDIAATDQIFYYDVNDKSKVNSIVQLTKDIADYSGYSITALPNGKDKIVACRMSITEPTEIFSVDEQSGMSEQITFTNKEYLSKFTLGKVEKRMIKATDGKDILTWVIYPPNFDPKKKYPTLLYCQGGPQSTVSQFFSYRWNFQLMAANQYIIVAPCRRGMPGFGQEWNDQISKNWGGQCMNDLLSSIDSVSKEPFVNRDKMGAVGASFGGYSVFWLEGNHKHRFKAFISHCGVFNLESMIATEELFFHNYEFDGAYWRTPRPISYEKFSPHRYVQNWDTPILIISNEKDYRVPYTQGLEAYSAARMKNVPARFLSFSDEGHWVLKPQNSIMWQREFFNWLDKYLK